MLSAANRRAGDEVRRLMVDKGWTPDDMSAEIFRQCGARFAPSERTIYRVLTGEKPSVRKQFGIAHVLGLTPSQLWEPTKRKAVAR